MKPTSIIFLAVALLLTLGGFVTMRIAESLAAKEGIELLPQTELDSESYIFSYDFTEDTIGKIDINIKDAKINIIGGAQKSSIELINFADGLYEFSSSNRILTVSNNSNLSSFDTITSMIMSFKGIRSLINLYNISDREKTVNIYLAADTEVKVVSCKLESGEVKLSGCATQTDYNITIGKGDVTVDSINTTSSVKCELGSGDISITDSVIASLEIDAEKSDVSLLRCDHTSISADIEKGSFELNYIYDLTYINLDLFTGVGDVTVDSTQYGGYYQVLDQLGLTKFVVTVGSGDITLTSAPQY